MRGTVKDVKKTNPIFLDFRLLRKEVRSIFFLGKLERGVQL